MSSPAISKMTKELFATSLKKYMKRKPLNKITIQEIAQDCGLNRRTFYRHFKDIYDLVEWIYQTEIENQISQYIDFPHWRDALLDLFNYFLSNKEISHFIVKVSDHKYLEQFLYGAMIKFIQPVIEKESYTLTLSQHKKDFLSNFYALSFISILIQWIDLGMEDTPDEIVKNISLILKGSISRILEPY
ncbi:TetR/AcrR family transcriptional regulator C-terminal domain-containing protein [Clostridium uliginosum]|uniref:Probable dihydroxyacetone kinase regulator n=1 Tax=Clostridium uliginosum TaxID=119641 RepID=A0A1I1JMK1_9CLOT|nr:TetR/AcrR family transcriptional regulator C-terminal domain-containing protein [Clostridium uliginosum]SFC47808.1 probable dihydroxyacetone kinase regulator [Clostridium uliginosum]